jgi:alpha-tubulin suppressor-like RCC1 family protein
MNKFFYTLCVFIFHFTYLYAAGQSHSIFIDAANELRAWGSNDHGQLGTGDYDKKTTQQIVGSGNIWVQVAQGENFNLALNSNGEVFSFGINNFGQLGFGDNFNRNVPSKISSLPAMQSISAGTHHAMGIDISGNAWAWGRNTHGQLGDGTNIDRTSPLEIKSSGQVIAAQSLVAYWKLDEISGNVIDSSLQGNDATPIGIPPRGLQGKSFFAYDFDALNHYLTVADGASNQWSGNISITAWIKINGAITNNRTIVSKWGTSEGFVFRIFNDSKLKFTYGNGTTTGGLDSIYNFSDDGLWHHVAITFDASNVKMYIDGSLDASSTPTISSLSTTNSMPLEVGKLSDQASNAHFFKGLLDEIRIYNIALTGPEITNIFNNDIEQFTKVTLGADHSIAIDNSGKLWGMGSNKFNQITASANIQVSTPIIIDQNNMWSDIASGFFHNLGITAMGNLYSWGKNFQGQCGLGHFNPVAEPTMVDTASDWGYIYAGAGHTLIIKTDNSVWGCGSNHQGQLGLGSVKIFSMLTQIGVDTDWMYTLCIGAYHSIINKNNVLYGMGLNYCNIISINSDKILLAPTHIGPMPGIPE